MVTCTAETEARTSGEDRIQRAVTGRLDSLRTRTVIVGVSGGADSVALAHVLRACAAGYGLALHIAHFDHALRPSSADDARFVAALAAEWGIPFHTARWEHGDRFPGGVEAAARKARYRFLAGVARAVTPRGEEPVVIVAHHLDDQAETALLNLVRGTGHRGLVGMRHDGPMPEQGQGRRVRLVRPLLWVRREELRAYAAQQGLAWREDETNAVPDRARTIIRHNVLPELERLRAGASVAIANFAAVDASLHERLQRLRAMMLTVCLVEQAPRARALFSVAALHALDRQERADVLYQGMTQVFGYVETLDFRVAQRLAALLDGPLRAGGPHPLVRGLAWTLLGARRAEALRLAIHRSDLLPLEPQHPWLDAVWRATIGRLHLPLPSADCCWAGWWLESEEQAPPQPSFGDPWAAWLDADRVAGLALTVPKPGMRFAPLGMGGRTRSLGDFFTDRKVPTALRPGWPLVVDSATAEIVWVCGLAVGHHAALRPETGRAMHLRWRKDARL